MFPGHRACPEPEKSDRSPRTRISKAEPDYTQETGLEPKNQDFEARDQYPSPTFGSGPEPDTWVSDSDLKFDNLKIGDKIFWKIFLIVEVALDGDICLFWIW